MKLLTHLYCEVIASWIIKYFYHFWTFKNCNCKHTHKYRKQNKTNEWPNKFL